MSKVIDVVDWRITYECDNRCYYCFGFKNQQRMSLEEEQIVLDKICSFPSKAINLTGGEPLLNVNRTFNIISKLASNGKKVYLSTNGTNLLNNIDFINKNVSLLGLPIDGYDEKSSLINGRSAKSFNNIISVLELLNDESPIIKIGTVITKKVCNREFINNVYNLLSKYKIDIWRIYEVLPVNRGYLNKDSLELNQDDVLRLTEYVEEIKKNNPKFKIELVTRSMRNSAYFMIEANGNVILPREHNGISEELVIGNLIKEDIEVLYNKWHNSINKDKICDYEITRKCDIEGK